MRQILAFGKFGFHNGIDERVAYHRIGFARQWRVLLRAWGKFERYEILQNDRGFTDIDDIVRGSHRDTVYAEDVVVDPNTGRSETAVYVHPLALDELAAGCQELRDMLNADAAGEFLGYPAEPLLDPDEDRDVRELIRQVTTVQDRRIVKFHRRQEAARWTSAKAWISFNS